MTCTFPQKRRRCAKSSSAAAAADAFLPSYHLRFTISSTLLFLSGPLINPTPEKRRSSLGRSRRSRRRGCQREEKKGGSDDLLLSFSLDSVSVRLPTFSNTLPLFLSLIFKTRCFLFFAAASVVSLSFSALLYLLLCPLGWILVSRCLGPHPFGKRPSLVPVFLPSHRFGAPPPFPPRLSSSALASLRGPPFDGWNLCHVREGRFRPPMIALALSFLR